MYVGIKEEKAGCCDGCVFDEGPMRCGKPDSLPKGCSSRNIIFKKVGWLRMLVNKWFG